MKQIFVLFCFTLSFQLFAQRSGGAANGGSYGTGGPRDHRVGFYCGSGDFAAHLYNTRKFIHSLQYTSCKKAVKEVMAYDFFCDGGSMYSQFGILEAGYSTEDECLAVLND